MQSIGTFLILLFILLGQTTQGQVWNVVTIQFENLQTNNGSIMLLVQNDFEKEVLKLVIPIENRAASATLKLQAGGYGFSAYQDESSNKKLDLNFFGAPTEVYGFSNNARGFFGKPAYAETLVKIDSSQTIKFKLE